MQTFKKLDIYCMCNINEMISDNPLKYNIKTFFMANWFSKVLNFGFEERGATEKTRRKCFSKSHQRFLFK